jgi:hypothetical protein
MKKRGDIFKQAQIVLDEMQNGANLHLSFSLSSAPFALSNGRKVFNAVAEIVINSASVADCGVVCSTELRPKRGNFVGRNEA